MAIHRIDSRIWNDAAFRALAEDAKLAYLFLATHPQQTQLGAMRATAAGLGAELGWKELARIETAMTELKKVGLVEWDKEAALVVLPRYIADNPPGNPNMVKGFSRIVDQLPECALRDATVHRAKNIAAAISPTFAKAVPPRLDSMAKRHTENTYKAKQTDHTVSEAPPRSPLEIEEELLDIDTPEAVDTVAEEPSVCAPPCPYDHILSAYNDFMPDNPRVREWTDILRKTVAARWRDMAAPAPTGFGYNTQEPGIVAWQEFFKHCAKSAFLTGKVPPKGNSPIFFADIGWLMRPKNLVKVRQGQYHRKSSHAG